MTEKAKKALDEKEDNLILCYTTEDSKPVQEKKVNFPAHFNFTTPHTAVLTPMQEMRMMCTINDESLYMFTINSWICDSSISCHITKNDTGMFKLEKIVESAKGGLSNKSAMKQGKICVNVVQVDGSKRVHTLWPV